MMDKPAGKRIAGREEQMVGGLMDQESKYTFGERLGPSG
jgi:hypothetical protein